MLAELLAFLMMPASPAARRLGFVYEMVALQARARRQAKAWKPHQDAARTAISRLAEGVDARDCAAVLGSGWLLEVPLEDLCARFRRVILVDMVFPRSVRRQAQRAANVQLIEADISGVLTTPFLSAPSLAGVPFPAPFPPDVVTANFVVSANILSQLPVHMQKIARTAGKRDVDVDGVARRLIEAHLGALRACQGSVCLLSDFEREERAGQGLRERFDLLYGVRPRMTGPRWWWDIAPDGEDRKGVRIRHQVMCGLLGKS